MENKELKIKIPKGYCIDEENSTFECIKFKPKKVTYEDVAREMFAGKYFYIDQYGDIDYINDDLCLNLNIQEANNAASKKQLEKLLAINKLMTIAKYLNGDWKPDWSNIEDKYYLYLNSDNIPSTGITTHNCIGIVHFRKPTDIRQAIDILGEDTIRLALSTDW